MVPLERLKTWGLMVLEIRLSDGPCDYSRYIFIGGNMYLYPFYTMFTTLNITKKLHCRVKTSVFREGHQLHPRSRLTAVQDMGDTVPQSFKKRTQQTDLHPWFMLIIPGWLLVYLPLWKMMDWKSVGMIFPFPIWWESHKIPWFQSPPTRYIVIPIINH